MLEFVAYGSIALGLLGLIAVFLLRARRGSEVQTKGPVHMDARPRKTARTEQRASPTAMASGEPALRENNGDPGSVQVGAAVGTSGGGQGQRPARPADGDMSLERIVIPNKGLTS